MTKRSEFGARLVEARKRIGLTQTALAKKVGMSQSAYAEAETSGQGTAYVPQIAKLCGVDPEWLATGKGSPVQDPFSNWPFPRITPMQLKGLPAKYQEIVENLALSMLDLSQNVVEQQEDEQAPSSPQSTFTVHKDDQRGAHPHGKSDSDEAERPRDQRPAGGRT